MREKKSQPFFHKGLAAALLLVLVSVLVVTVVELAQPGLVRGKLYTAYFVAKAATWEWEYPNGIPDTRAIDRVVQAILAPDIAQIPAKTWRAGVPEPFKAFLPEAAGGLRPVDYQQAPLSPPGADWKYLAGRSIQGGEWRELAYDDSGWKTGQAPLALVSGSASTQLVEGTEYPFYLRREFLVEDPSIYRLLDLELLGGDGAVVYLNGTELYRNNRLAGEMPSQAADGPVSSRAAGTYYLYTTDAGLLRAGLNVLAVELPRPVQAGSNGSFDLSVRGALQSESVRFAVIADFGTGGKQAREVADLVKRWEPYFILTNGDNNYSSGDAQTIDKNVGQFYHDYMAPYYGRYGPGADRNRFFPTMGNHDWSDNHGTPSPPNAYLNYFTLPPGQGNERYYDFQWGPVHFFALDSDINEPDGISSTSIQGRWLQEQLRESRAPWKLVYMHHPPFASAAVHPTIKEHIWPFAAWGASLVVSGHNHFYERIERDNIPFIVNGPGGGELYPAGAPTEGSQVRFSGYGAMLVQGGPCNLHIWYITADNAVIDHLQLENPASACQ